jgi:hypothetical protein
MDAWQITFNFQGDSFPPRNCNTAHSSRVLEPATPRIPQGFWNQQHAALVFNPEDQVFWNRRRIAMTDPRYTDPRYGDPRSDTGLGDSIGGPWGWIAGIAAVVLIAFLVFAGIKQGINTASDKPLASTTTGFGGSSPQPMSPPARSGQ